MKSNDELTLANYSSLPNQILRDPAYAELDMTAFLAWQLIFNRYQSSQKKAQFWDAKQNDWYAIYPLKELKVDLHCGLSKAARTLKALTKVGLLEKKLVGLHRAYRLFPKVPYTYTKAGWVKNKTKVTTNKANKPIKSPKKSVTKPVVAQSFNYKASKRSFVRPNYLISNYLTSDTANTINPENVQLKPALNSQPENQPEHDDRELQALAENYQSHYGLPKSAVAVIKAYSEKSAEKFMHYMSLMFQAKKTAVKYVQQHVTTPFDRTLLQHETNPVVQTSLGTMLQRLFIYMRKNTKDEIAADKYFKRSLDNFYQEAFNSAMQGVSGY
ncbi:hypothetical protein C1940_16675 (plasmid) [Lactiplantibacillus plantarum subsp. plantarum]|uniref:hypothetical protein n=1 Tax=Lactiplantibacillus plantarum TaxID=1590 RepID=UPI000CD364A4|nr:hypothetical protein [Lactiplantibacillus plantarum]AUV74099.1 hypothetical protein C1940_16675 [Lactiplantibacillus plantarum subsp. plantarum]